MKNVTLLLLALWLAACSAPASPLARHRAREALTYDHRPDYWVQMKALKLPEDVPLDVQLRLIAHGFDSHVSLALASQLSDRMDHDPQLEEQVIARMESPVAALAWAATWTMDKCGDFEGRHRDRILSTYERADVLAFMKAFRQ